VGKDWVARPRLAGVDRFSRASPSSVADHDRPHAGTVPAVAITVAITVAIPIPVPIPIAVPEAPIAIVIVIAEEAACAADAIVAKPSTDAFDLFDDAQLVLCRLNAGCAGEADRIGALRQQRRAENGCGAERPKQELVHSDPPCFAVEAR
jgi:hypothetical protein